MHVSNHFCHLFDDDISFEGSVIADRRADGVLFR
jgi:hypothetical protein